MTLSGTFRETKTRCHNRVILTLFGLMLCCAVAPVWGQADQEESQVTSSSELFPDTSVFYVSVPSFKTMSDAFSRTDFGKMFDDPALKPFLQDLRGQLEEKFADEIQRSGLTLENLQQVEAGEAAFATIVYSEGSASRSGSAFLIHVGDDDTLGQRLQGQIEANLQARQAKKMPDVEFGGVQVKYYEPKRDGGEIRKPRVFFVHTDSWVVVTNKQPILEMLLESIGNGGAAQPLSESPDFQFVRQRLDATELPESPQLSWFAAPFALAKVIRDEQVTPGKTSRYLMAMEKTGFDVIKGVGGDFSFDVNGDEYFFQAFVAVPGEGTLMERLRESSSLLSFSASEEAGELSPGPWVRDTAADVLTWYWDSGAAFRAAEPLVDQLYDEGTFQRVVNDIRNAESTQVDLAALASSLGPRWTYASEVVPPLDGSSEKLLLAIELRDPEVAKLNFRNYLKADWYRLRDADSVGGLELWEFEGEPAGDGDIISILDPEGTDSEEEELEEDLLLGMRSFCFPKGQNYVLASNDPNYLVEVIKSQRGLTDLPAYGALREKLQPFLKGAPSFYSFALQDRVHELSYQLLRKGTLPESETRLESTLRMIFGTENGVVREQEIDGATMPEDYHGVVAPYLGPSGWLVSAEDHGWMIVGAGLKSASSDK